MITLADLAALHTRYADDLARPIAPVTITHPTLDDVTIGDGAITLMSTINLSRDSTYRESVAVSTDAAVRMARTQVAEGAALVDLGAESSTATATRVDAQAQIDLLLPVIEALASETVLSVETYEPAVVKAALSAGARVLNMTGREHEEEMLRLAGEYDATVILCFGDEANVRVVADVPREADPLQHLIEHLGPRIERARALGVRSLVVDPGLGFYYGNLTDPLVRARHQMQVLAQCFRLRQLGVPVCNVLPHTFALFEAEFRKAEGFYATFAALGGTQLLRVHEVPHVRTVLAAMEHLSAR